MDVEHYRSRAKDSAAAWTDLEALDERGAPVEGIPADSVRGHIGNALMALEVITQESAAPDTFAMLGRCAARLRGVLAALADNEPDTPDDPGADADGTLVGVRDGTRARSYDAGFRAGLQQGRQRMVRQYLAADIRARRYRDVIAGFLAAWDAHYGPEGPATRCTSVGYKHLVGCVGALRAELSDDPEPGTVGPAEFSGMVHEALDDADAESEPDTTGEAAAEEFAENGAVRVRTAAVGAVVDVILRRFPRAFGGIELSRWDGDWVDVVSLW